jgi:hypothetical protein
MKRLLRLYSHRKSSRELLSTSAASWATTKSVGMCKSEQQQARAPARKGQQGSYGRQHSLASLTKRMRVAGSGRDTRHTGTTHKD